MALLSLTITTCFEVVYVSEKSIFLSLSAVTVIPAAPKSAFPDWTAVMIESNSISSIFKFIPR